MLESAAGFAVWKKADCLLYLDVTLLRWAGAEEFIFQDGAVSGDVSRPGAAGGILPRYRGNAYLADKRHVSSSFLKNMVINWPRRKKHPRLAAVVAASDAEAYNIHYTTKCSLIADQFQFLRLHVVLFAYHEKWRCWLIASLPERFCPPVFILTAMSTCDGFKYKVTLIHRQRSSVFAG